MGLVMPNTNVGRSLRALYTFFTLSYFVVELSADPQTTYAAHGCSPNTYSNAAVFKQNLDAVFSAMAQDVSSTGFATASHGQGTDAVFGLAQCRDDLSMDDCVECYKESQRRITNYCPGVNGARLIFDGCFLRYENNTFFDQTVDLGFYQICSSQANSRPEIFNQTVRSFLAEINDRAAKNGGYAANENGSPTPIYGLAMCRRTLPMNSCQVCLNKATELITQCLPNNDGRGLEAGCYLRYSTLPFFSIHSNSSSNSSRVGTGGSSKVDPLSVVLFQGFNWESWKSNSWYTVLKSGAKDIADAGITDVWFPPCSQSQEPQGYMPGKLYELDSSNYGTKEQLKGAVEAFHENGVRCVGDIVINHRSGSKQDDEGNCFMFEGGTDDDRLDWGGWAIPPNDKPYTCGSAPVADTGDDFAGAPDLDHTNPRVQTELSDWMNWLKTDIGFDGWRFDFATGFAGNLVGLYLQNTSPAFAVGEFWVKLTLGQEDAHRQRLVEWMHSTGDRSAAFDFTTKGILQQAVENNELWRMRDSNGKPSGLIGLLPEKAVTFVDNHDTGSTQKQWPFPQDKLLQGYAYILTHPGVPSIFYDHWEDMKLKEAIRNLTGIRKRNNIRANSTCRIIVAENDLYMASMEERVISKIGARYDVGEYTPSPDFKIVASGDGYSVWEKQSSM